MTHPADSQAVLCDRCHHMKRHHGSRRCGWSWCSCVAWIDPEGLLMRGKNEEDTVSCDGDCRGCTNPGEGWGHRGRDGIRATDEQWAASLNAVLNAWHDPVTAEAFRKARAK